jgi:hypothetical protein
MEMIEDVLNRLFEIVNNAMTQQELEKSRNLCSKNFEKSAVDVMAVRSACQLRHSYNRYRILV